MKDGFKSRFPDFLFSSSKQEKFPNHQWISPSTERSTDRRVILAGDSHMQAVSHAVYDAFRSRNFSYAQSIWEACPLIAGLDRMNKQTGRKHFYCVSTLNEQRLDFIKNSPPALVILGGRLPMFMEEDRFDNEEGGDEGDLEDVLQYAGQPLGTKQERNRAIARAYEGTVEQILQAGHSVVLIYPIPEVGRHVPMALFDRIDGHYLDARHIVSENPLTTSYEVFKRRVRSSYALLDSIQGKNIYRVYPEKIFCNTEQPGRCMTHDRDHVFYKDDDHLSPEGASLLVREIMRVIPDEKLTDAP
jgi:hypothetical protein